MHEMVFGDYLSSDRKMPHTKMKMAKRCFGLYYNAGTILSGNAGARPLLTLEPQRNWKLALYNLMNNREGIKLGAGHQQGDMEIDEAVKLLTLASSAMADRRAGALAKFGLYELFKTHKNGFQLSMNDLQLEAQRWTIFVNSRNRLTLDGVDSIPATLLESVKEVWEPLNETVPSVPEVAYLKLICAGVGVEDALRGTPSIVSMICWKSAELLTVNACSPTRACGLACFDPEVQTASPLDQIAYPTPGMIDHALKEWLASVHAIYCTTEVDDILNEASLKDRGMTCLTAYRAPIPRAEWAARLFALRVRGAPQKFALHRKYLWTGASDESSNATPDEQVLRLLVTASLFASATGFEKDICGGFFLSDHTEREEVKLGFPILHLMKRLLAVGSVARFLRHQDRLPRLQALTQRVSGRAKQDTRYRNHSFWERPLMLLAAAQEEIVEEKWMEDAVLVMSVKARGFEWLVFKDTLTHPDKFDEDVVSTGIAVWRELREYVASPQARQGVDKYGVAPIQDDRDIEWPLIVMMKSGLTLKEAAQLLPAAVCLLRLGLTMDVVGGFFDAKSPELMKMGLKELRQKLVVFSRAAEFQHRERARLEQGMRDRNLTGRLSQRPRDLVLAIYHYLLSGKPEVVAAFLDWQRLYAEVMYEVDSRTRSLVDDFTTGTSRRLSAPQGRSRPAAAV